jgi:hypothetical protein
MLKVPEMLLEMLLVTNLLLEQLVELLVLV